MELAAASLVAPPSGDKKRRWRRGVRAKNRESAAGIGRRMAGTGGAGSSSGGGGGGGHRRDKLGTRLMGRLRRSLSLESRAPCRERLSRCARNTAPDTFLFFGGFGGFACVDREHVFISI